MLQALIGPVAGLLDKFIPDADEKMKIAAELSTMAERHGQEIALAQIGINREEAKGNWFQSGWRPETGWVCVGGFAVNFLISPLVAPFGIIVPQVETATMLPVLLGMLGLGGMRTMERVKGVGK